MNLSWLIPAGKGIPVLMYHRVWPNQNDSLTITPERLREQWRYMKEEGYKTLSLGEYLDVASGKAPFTEKTLLITFDDGYRNNLQYAYPLLKELGWKATFFIIGNTLNGSSDRVNEVEQKMTLDELRSLDPEVVQVAMHGFAHRNFGDINEEDMRAEVGQAIQAFDNSKLPYEKVWAYAYGARPGRMASLKKMMQEAGIKAAFRIGNQVSKVPATDLFEIKRIDIKGTDTLERFKIKLWKGKLKPF